MECFGLSFQPVPGLARGNLPSGTQLDRQVENQGQVGLEAAGGRLVDPGHHRQRQPTADGLIGERGQVEAVAEDDPSGFERGANHLPHDIRAGGGVVQKLSLRSPAAVGVQQLLAERFGRGSAPRLAHHHRLVTRLPEPLGERPGQGTLPRPLGTFQHDEETTHARVMMLLVAPRSIPAAMF